MSKSTVRKFGVGVASLALLASVAAPAMAAEDYNRLGGADRYQTAVAISDKVTAKDVVYLARGNVFADAVVAGKLTDGPILLLDDSTLSKVVVKQQIAKLNPAKGVVVLGGKNAISDELAKEVAGSKTVTRVSGDDRFATAAEISKRVTKNGKHTKVFLANGMTMVDALTGGQVTGGDPILLTDGSGKLPKATEAEIKRLGAVDFVALGGTKAVSDSELQAAALVNVDLKGVAADAVKTAKNEKARAEAYIKGWDTYDKTKADEAAFTGTAPVATATDGNANPYGAGFKMSVENKSQPTNSTVGNDYPTAQYENSGSKIEKGATATAFIGWKQAVDLAKAVTADLTVDAIATQSLLQVNPQAAGTDSIVKIDKDIADAKAAWEAAGKPVGTAAVATRDAYVAAVVKKLSATSGSANTVLTGAATTATNYTTIAMVENLAAGTSDYTGATVYTLHNYADAKAEFDGWKAYLAAAEKGLTDAAAKISEADKIINGATSGKVSLQRWAGADRYETSIVIAKNSGSNVAGTKVYLANGASYADAVVGGMLNGVILLVPAGEGDLPLLTQETIKSVKAGNSYDAKRQVVSLGLSGAVSNKTLDAAIALVTK